MDEARKGLWVPQGGVGPSEEVGGRLAWSREASPPVASLIQTVKVTGNSCLPAITSLW